VVANRDLHQILKKVYYNNRAIDNLFRAKTYIIQIKGLKVGVLLTDLAICVAKVVINNRI